MFGAAALLFCACEEQTSHTAGLSAEVKLFGQLELPCARSAQRALIRAQDLERMAVAHWERVPFATEEAPLAVIEMAEAESCYALAGDRVSKLRVQGRRHMFEQEVARRFARARLNLDVASRAGQLRRALREVEEMIALLKRSDDAAYRDSLTRLSHSYAAKLAEQENRGGT